MSGAISDKALLKQYNDGLYQSFKLNNDLELSLIQPSSVPWISASSRRDIYKKVVFHPDAAHHVSFITKNNDPHEMLWKTQPDKLKQAVRWGIVKSESTTGRVISALGNYRIAAHKRVIKGMISNSQTLKLKLLDLFQERFEALQQIECLINRTQTYEDYQAAFKRYNDTLMTIKDRLDADFPEANWVGFDANTIAQLKTDLEQDQERASNYFKSLNRDNIAAHNQARGHASTGEFVKQQMLRGLYELQGINQDITYSNKRFFALTRGELNDAIEDARKKLDEHQTDLSNAVTMEHHGLYSDNPEQSLTYDFSSDHLSPKRERDVLLAISFIEGWDKIENNQVISGGKAENLDVIAATRWKTHRSLWAATKSFGFYLLNLVKSFFVTTHPRETETWANPDFHLEATTLMKHAHGNEPLWQKPYYFLKQFAMAAVDIIKGIRNIGRDLVIEMPADIANDWESSGELPTLESTLLDLDVVITKIAESEQQRLDAIRAKSNYAPPALSNSTSQLAKVDYPLEVGDQNDILTALARGLNEFGSVFAHNIYAKDPFAGLAFTAAYALGAAALYFPAATSSIMGSGYVSIFTSFSYSMAASKPAAMIAGGSTQAQIAALGVDTLEHGPTGLAFDAIYQIGEDPLTVAAYFGAALGLGHLLIDGIQGQAIPWLSELLKEDLGTNPMTGTTLFGGKFGVALFELLHVVMSPILVPTSFAFNGGDVILNKRDLGRVTLLPWLLKNLKTLPQLNSKQISSLSRQIDSVFTKEESTSLKKMLYPKKKRSIAFQLLYIPLSYIPVLFRALLSVVLSIAAALSAHPNPLAPMKQAWGHLGEKVKKDLSRLLVFAGYVLYVPYMFVATIVKMLAYCTTLIIGRIAGWCDLKPGHAIHQAFAAIHGFFRRIGELLYPVRLLKDVTPAHPMHTVKEIESSYVRSIRGLGNAVREKDAENTPEGPLKSTVEAANETQSHACAILSAQPSY